MKITMARFHVVAIAAGLLLAISGPSFAAKRTLQKSDTKTVKSQSHEINSSGSAIRPHSRELAVIMHRIWVDGTEFSWTRQAVAA